MTALWWLFAASALSGMGLLAATQYLYLSPWKREVCARLGEGLLFLSLVCLLLEALASPTGR